MSAFDKNEKAGQEVLDALHGVAQMTVIIVTVMKLILESDEQTDAEMKNTFQSLSTHFEEIWDNLTDPDELTKGEAYNFLFTVRNTTVPKVVKMEEQFHIERNSLSEYLKQALTF